MCMSAINHCLASLSANIANANMDCANDYKLCLFFYNLNYKNNL